MLPDVALVTKDVATTITPNDTVWQVARGSTVTDGDGTRRATLLVPPNTTATNLTATSYTFRLTEATKGAAADSLGGTYLNGPAAMPANLPPQSGYTYAIELGADEADLAGIAPLTFNNQMLFYMENFTGGPLSDAGTSTSVPSGSYNRAPDAGAWVQEQSGVAVMIMGTSTDGGGNAVVQLTVDGTHEMNYSDPSVVPAITDAEREQLYFRCIRLRLASPIGVCPCNILRRGTITMQKRFQRTRFLQSQLRRIPAFLQNARRGESGSIIECEGRVLGEVIAIPDTPFTLHYRSENQGGFTPTLTIPVTGAYPSPYTAPPDLDHIEVEIQVAGVSSIVTYKSQLLNTAPPANITEQWSWDRKDAYGRTVQGTTVAHVSVTYVYNLGGLGDDDDIWRRFGNGTSISHRADQVRVTSNYDVPIGSFDDASLGLGGWTLSANHVYEPASSTLWRGDGTKVIPRSHPNTIEGIFSSASALQGLAIGGDGTIYLAEAGGTRE